MKKSIWKNRKRTQEERKIRNARKEKQNREKEK